MHSNARERKPVATNLNRASNDEAVLAQPPAGLGGGHLPRHAQHAIQAAVPVCNSGHDVRPKSGTETVDRGKISPAVHIVSHYTCDNSTCAKGTAPTQVPSLEALKPAGRRNTRLRPLQICG